VKVLGLAIVLLLAPLQCGRAPSDHPEYEDSPGEALWDLSERFGAEGDEEGRRRTLAYLIERYPSSRFAERARVVLGQPHETPPP
jgi:TolA-binding protein